MQNAHRELRNAKLAFYWWAVFCLVLVLRFVTWGLGLGEYWNDKYLPNYEPLPEAHLPWTGEN